MLSHGLNGMKQAQLMRLVDGHKGKFTNSEMSVLANKLQCTKDTIRGFLPLDMQEPDKEVENKALKNIAVVKALNEKDDRIESLVRQVHNSERKFTGKQLWDIYTKAVGGKTDDNKPLPEYSKLDKQQKGWVEVATFVSN